jgi:methionine-gamma-lyase
MSTPISFPIGERTTAIHAGEAPDPVTRASSPNLVMSTTFVTDANAGFSVEGIFRLSVGLEDADDLIHDLELALE